MTTAILKAIKSGLCAIAFVLSFAAHAAPAPSPDPLANFQHTQWTAENGVPADISGMAQTPDGWLWLTTSSGLFRFDGVRFARAPGRLGRERTRDMFAAPNGDLYVSVYGGGLLQMHPDGRVEDVPGSDGPVVGTLDALAMDRDGTLWAIGQGVYRRSGGGWENMDGDPVWRESSLRSLLVDGAGRLWACSDAGVKRFDAVHGRFELVDGHAGSLGMTPDGAVWVLPKNGGAAVRLSTPSANLARPPRFNPSGSRFAGIFDARGTLWKLRCGAALCLDGAAAPLQSGGTPRQILEDREGDVWIATERGLERFRPAKLTRSGLGASVDASMADDADGRVWATDGNGALWQLRAGEAPRPVPATPALIVAKARGGGILVEGPRSIRRMADGRVTEIPLPPGEDGKPRDRKPFVLLDDGKMIWTAAADTSLIGWDGTRWRPWHELGMTDKLYRLVPGGPGQVWLARGPNELVLYDNGKRTHYDATAVGWITGIFPGSELVVGGDGGLGVLADGRIRMLHPADADALRSISGLVVTPEGDRWLNGAAGLLHVRAADWQRALADPRAALRYEVFGPGDGYPGRALIENAQPSALSADGRRLWFIGTDGIATFDTGAAHRNDAAPLPLVETVSTPHGDVVPAGPVRIASGTERFGIQFTAPLLRMPERARFEYRMDGFDTGWQDAGTRRTAEYTRVPPGAYHFRVRAFNEDGVAGSAEAVLPLQVEPTVLQSLWFQALFALLLVVLALSLVRYRVRYLTARLTERLRVKTAERERIARALHDSFLQSLQALLMRLDTVAAGVTDTSARRELEAIRDHANNALVEGRGHLTELRAADAIELDDAIERSLQHLRETTPGVALALRLQGERRALHGAIADEVGDIAREALRNAVAHSGARTIRVVLGYGRRALTVSVTDDGQGLPKEVVQAGGRPGHWGLAGMRERAGRIGGLLAIDSQPGRGTAVRVAVPAKRAYLD